MTPKTTPTIPYADRLRAALVEGIGSHRRRLHQRRRFGLVVGALAAGVGLTVVVTPWIGPTSAGDPNRPSTAEEAAATAEEYASSRGVITSRNGCWEVSAGKLAAIQAERAASNNGPVEGWLREAPESMPIWLCDYLGSFGRAGSRIGVVLPAEGAPDTVGSGLDEVPVPLVGVLLGELAEAAAASQ